DLIVTGVQTCALPILTGDKIRGGDAAFAYFGTLTQTDNGFTAHLETKRHAHGRASVFNMEPVHIHLAGRSEGANAVCTGTAVERSEERRVGKEGRAGW